MRMGEVMETNKEVRNDELKTAMITLNLQDDKQSEDEFINELRKAYLLVPAINEQKKDNMMVFMLLTNQTGDHYFQCYTDMDEYNKWGDAQESQSFVLTFDEFANIILSCEDDIKGLVINPFTENIVLNISALTNIFRMGKVYIDEVSSCPKKIRDKIEKILKKKELVDHAYLMNMKNDNVPGYLLIIDSKVQNKKKLLSEIGNEIKKSFDEINIDILSSTDEIAKDVIKGKKPFYNKIK